MAVPDLPTPAPLPARAPAITLDGLPVAPEIAARVLRYVADAEGALAANTLRALRADVHVWTRWCRERGVVPLPAIPRAVADFVHDVAATRAPATVRRYLASLALLHRAAELPSPTGYEAVRLAMKKAAKGRGGQRQAAPLDAAAVDRILAHLARGRRPIDLRDRALVLVARDLLARRGELVALAVADVEPLPDEAGATARFRRSKTDQAGVGETGYLSPAAFDALRRWLAAAGITEGAVFRAVRRTDALGGPLGDAEVARVFRKLARRAGVASAESVAGHSARVGMAQDLVAAGLDLPAIMQAGRWKTTAMPARYAERLLAARNAVARYHAGREQGGR